MEDKTASQQIDDIIANHVGWKGALLTQLRAAIQQADPDVTEEIKWRMKRRPEGLAVWSHDGTICLAEIWKDNIKLLFPKGAALKDSDNLFNARLQSKDIRAIQFMEGDKVNTSALIALVRQALTNY